MPRAGLKDDDARERDEEWLDPAQDPAPAQQPAPPRHHAKVGYSMILVAASLAVIGVLHLSIGEEVLYADQIQRAQTANYEACAESGFGEGCERYMPFVNYERCVSEGDLESPECKRYTTWVESEIFEGCRSARDSTSPECERYAGLY